jgi:hypothetical protein
VHSWPTLAQERKFGAWSVRLGDDGGAYAGTTNESGGFLAQFCFREQERCVWTLSVNLNCEDGSTYTALVNSDSGAFATQIVCKKFDDNTTAYKFTDFDRIDSTIRTSEWVGFAFPLASGRFQVSRFPMNGASSAVATLSKLMSSRSVKSSVRGTRDQQL